MKTMEQRLQAIDNILLRYSRTDEGYDLLKTFADRLNEGPPMGSSMVYHVIVAFVKGAIRYAWNERKKAA